MRGPGARGRVREVGGRAGNPAGSLLGRRAFPWELEVSSRGVVSSGPQEDGWLWGGGFEGVSSGQERSCGLVVVDLLVPSRPQRGCDDPLFLQQYL